MEDVKNENFKKIDIEDLYTSPNIAELLDEDYLADMSAEVYSGYEIDLDSMEPWRKKYEGAMELAEQLRGKEKKFPFDGASNFMYPLISTAAIQFAARAYPQFMNGPNIVKTRVVGQDIGGEKAKKANRVSMHMSHQLLHQVSGFEEEIDKMFIYLPVIGTAFLKSYYDPIKEVPVVEFVRASDLIIHRYARSMDSVPRATHKRELYPNEIRKFINSGLFSDFEYGQAVESKHGDDEISTLDPQKAHVFLEQHTFLDLDGDGYDEPYIVTIHEDTKKIVRIVARFDDESIIYGVEDTIVEIIPEQHFTKFTFMQSMDGSIHGTGFGGILEPINRAINSSVNQLIDASTLKNLQSGIIGKGIHLGRGRGGGDWKFKPGEWKKVLHSGDDIRKNLVPLPFAGPAPETFSLIQLMIQAGEKQSSVTELMSGSQSNPSERPTTTLARIDQSLQVFSGVNKRVYRALTELYMKIFRMNAATLTDVEYYRVTDMQSQKAPAAPAAPDLSISQGPIPQLGSGEAVSAQPPVPDTSDYYSQEQGQNYVVATDYDYKSCDIVPAADPNEMTRTQKIIKAESLLAMRGQGLNDKAILRRWVEAIQDQNPDELLDSPPPPPPPELLMQQEEMQLQKDKFLFEMTKYADENPKRSAQLVEILTRSEKNVANAEATEKGKQIDLYRAHMDALLNSFKVQHENKQQEGDVNGSGNQQGGMGGVAQVPGNPGGIQNNAGAPNEAGVIDAGVGAGVGQGGLPDGVG